MDMNEENLTYEAALAELKQLVQKIEGPQMELSRAGEDVKRAVFLVKHCRAQLLGIQEEIDKILE